jgi:hypothetical protein
MKMQNTKKNKKIDDYIYIPEKENDLVCRILFNQILRVVENLQIDKARH